MKLKQLVGIENGSSQKVFLNLCYVEKMMERDYFMTAEEAVNFGLIDKVLEKRIVDPKSNEDKK